MNSFVILAALIAACGAQERYTATQLGHEIVITRSENDNHAGDGNFRWVSELSDGTKNEQSGYVKAGPDPEHPIQVIQGTFSYISPEGQQIDLQYIADENGFQPQGLHLPSLPQAAQVTGRNIVDPVYRKPQNVPTIPQQTYQSRSLEDQRLRLEEDQRLKRIEDENRARFEDEQRLRFEDEQARVNSARTITNRPVISPPSQNYQQPRRA